MESYLFVFGDIEFRMWAGRRPRTSLRGEMNGALLSRRQGRNCALQVSNTGSSH